MTRDDFIANLWRWSVGFPEFDDVPPPNASLDELRRTEWSPEFERLMRNRMILGAFRYGRLNAPGKAPYDRMPSIAKRALEYTRTGNLDLLLDVANLAMLEFEEGTHPNRHFDGEAHRDTVRRR